MDLDFTWLTQITQETAKRDFESIPTEKRPSKMPTDGILSEGEYKDTHAEEKPPESQETPVEGMGRLQRREAEKKADHERSARVYSEYQENIKRSGQLQTEILKGARAGEDPYSLLLKAVDAIARMTSNPLFYEQVRADLVAIHGEALLAPIPLAWELEAAQERLEKLQSALERETDPDDRQRIQAAINAHRADIDRLRGLTDQTQQSKLAV